MLTLRVSDALLMAVDAWADRHQLSRNQAGQRLIEQAIHGELAKLLPPSSGGYNPRTGEFDA